jgi:hypothetical protein
VRIGAKLCVGGAASCPEGLEQPISVKGMLPSSGGSGSTRSGTAIRRRSARAQRSISRTESACRGCRDRRGRVADWVTHSSMRPMRG